MCDFNRVIFWIIILNGMVGLWLLKAFVNFAVLYFTERKWIDAAIGLLFLAFTIDRAWSVLTSVQIWGPVGVIRLAPGEACETFEWRIVELVFLCLMCFLFDLAFYKYKPDRAVTK